MSVELKSNASRHSRIGVQRTQASVEICWVFCVYSPDSRAVELLSRSDENTEWLAPSQLFNSNSRHAVVGFLTKGLFISFLMSDSLKLSNQSEQFLINWLSINSTQLGNFMYFVKNLTEQNWAGRKYRPLDNTEDRCGTCAWKHTDSSKYI